MNILPDQEPELAHGCVRIVREAEGVFCDRLGDDLRGFYRDANVSTAEGFAPLARSPAGVRLRFRSDTTRIHAGFRYGRWGRPRFGSDLYVNSSYAGTYGADSEACPSWSGCLFETDTGREREFDLWLPYGSETWLTRLDIDADASFAPVPVETEVWIALGDSITQGMDASRSGRTYTAAVARRLGLGLRNTAVGGAGFTAAAAAAAAAAAEWQWQGSLATVALGLSDWVKSRPLDEFRHNVQTVLGAFFDASPQLRVALITPLPVVGFPLLNSLQLELEDYRRALRAVARARPPTALVEGCDLVAPAPSRFQDQTHPNDTGMLEIAAGLNRALSALL